MLNYVSLVVSRFTAELRREEGQGAVVYALVVLGVALVIALAVAGFATQITNFMTSAGTALQNVLGG